MDTQRDTQPLREASLSDEARQTGYEAQLADLRRLLDNSRDVIYRLSFETGRCEFVSASAKAVTGYSPEEFMAMDADSARAMIHPDDLPVFLAGLARLETTGKEELLYRQRNSEGEYRWLSNHMSLTRDSEGRPLYRIGVIRDVTRFKMAEDARRESEERLRFALETAEAGAWQLDLVDHTSIRSLKHDQIFGYETLLPEWTFETFLEHVLPADRAMVEARFNDAVARQEDWNFECRIRTADGQQRWIWASGRHLRESDGSVRRMGGIVQDITARKLAEETLRHREEERKITEALRAERQRLFNILESLPAMVCLLTSDYHVAFANRAFRELFGESQGRHCYDYRYGRSEPCEFCESYKVLETGQPHHWEVTTPTGNVIDVYDHPFTDVDGSPMILEMDFDITERRKAEAELMQHREHLEELVRERTEMLAVVNVQLREADRRKDEFLAMLAHELRNPLAPVRNAIEVLRLTGAEEPAQSRQRELIERQVNHMARLLDDLLDVSRITRGKIELRRERIRLVEILTHAVDAATAQVAARRQTLSFTPPSHNLFVQADADRLLQIVGNLLGNAVKYTPEEGQIWLEGGQETDSTGTAWAVIRVRDTGMGIDPHMLPHVFDLFAQADRSLAHTQGGLGIGLTMVDRLVQMHGGNVQAHSDGVSKGSEFIVRLPLLDADAPEQRSDKSPSRRVPRNMAAWRILVVDDVADSATSMAELLVLWGHEALAAFSGEAAIEMARQFNPDIMLLDIGMPGLDGYETARQLRAEYGPDDLYLVAITGYGQDTDRERTHSAGFNAHLVKPVDVNTLAALMESIARKKG